MEKSLRCFISDYSGKKHGRARHYHNHRVFNKRSKRGGFAPVELLNNIVLDKPLIDLLMDKIKAAFIQYGVYSLKALHAILTKKKKLNFEVYTNPNCSKIIAKAA